jgi:hypothetical protein
MRFVQSCGEVAEAIRSHSSTTVVTDRCCGTTMTPALSCDWTKSPKYRGIVFASCVTRMRFSLAAGARTSASLSPPQGGEAGRAAVDARLPSHEGGNDDLVEIGVRLEADHGYEASGVRRAAASFW